MSRISDFYQRHGTKIRWGALLIAVLAIWAAMQGLPIREQVDKWQQWVVGFGAWSPLVFGLIYIACTLLFIPGSWVTLAAGGIFGLWQGLLIVSLASTIGAALAFLIARYLARQRVAALAQRNERFGAIDEAVRQGGWKIVALLRLSPAIPFNLQNYLYGLTAIGFVPYVLASWVAMLPGTLLYVYLGHLAGVAVSQDRQRTTAEWVMLGVGLLATLVVTFYITRLARRSLNRRADEAVEP